MFPYFVPLVPFCHYRLAAVLQNFRQDFLSFLPADERDGNWDFLHKKRCSSTELQPLLSWSPECTQSRLWVRLVKSAKWDKAIMLDILVTLRALWQSRNILFSCAELNQRSWFPPFFSQNSLCPVAFNFCLPTCDKREDYLEKEKIMPKSLGNPLGVLLSIVQPKTGLPRAWGTVAAKTANMASSITQATTPISSGKGDFHFFSLSKGSSTAMGLPHSSVALEAEKNQSHVRPQAWHVDQNSEELS